MNLQYVTLGQEEKNVIFSSTDTTCIFRIWVTGISGAGKEITRYFVFSETNFDCWRNVTCLDFTVIYSQSCLVTFKVIHCTFGLSHLRN